MYVVTPPSPSLSLSLSLTHTHSLSHTLSLTSPLQHLMKPGGLEEHLPQETACLFVALTIMDHLD